MTAGGDGDTPARPNPVRRFLNADILPRIAVIALGVPCLIIITWRGGIYFLVLVDLVILLGMNEFYRLMSAKGFRPYRLLGTFCAIAFSWYIFYRGAALSFIVTAGLMLIMVGELRRKPEDRSVAHIAVTILGVMYVGWFGSHLVMLRQLPDVVGAGERVGKQLVFFTAAVTWAGDTAAYVCGIAFGRHKLIPRISPSKTVEGAAGGLLGAAAMGLLCAQTFASFLTPLVGTLLGLTAGFFGMLGDLVESLIKRDVGIKDSATLIPGHGGVLDRFDSLLFTAPVLYYYFQFFVV